MSNLYSQFLDLIPKNPLMMGEVTNVEVGAIEVTFFDGSKAIARGTGSIGQKVFVKDGMIQGVAPTLPLELIDI